MTEPNDDAPQHSLRTCIQEAETFLRDAESEVDGTEGVAIYQLLQACKWMLAGLEALEVNAADYRWAARKPPLLKPQKGDPP